MFYSGTDNIQFISLSGLILKKQPGLKKMKFKRHSKVRTLEIPMMSGHSIITAMKTKRKIKRNITAFLIKTMRNLITKMRKQND